MCSKHVLSVNGLQNETSVMRSPLIAKSFFFSIQTALYTNIVLPSSHSFVTHHPNIHTLHRDARTRHPHTVASYKTFQMQYPLSDTSYNRYKGHEKCVFSHSSLCTWKSFVVHIYCWQFFLLPPMPHMYNNISQVGNFECNNVKLRRKRNKKRVL